MNEVDAGIERLPISLPELVEAAPSMTADGSIILGRRQSKIYALDKHTGQALYVIADAEEELEDHSLRRLQSSVPDDSVLFLGRQDYVVRSLRSDTKAEAWNATFANMFMLNQDSGRTVGDILTMRQRASSSALGPAEQLAEGAGVPQLFVGADNTLRAFDRGTGYQKWIISFETPPVGAFSAYGDGSNHLAPPRGQRVPHEPKGYLGNAPHALDHSHKYRGHMRSGTSVLVGALRGSLYALPADHLILGALHPRPFLV